MQRHDVVALCIRPAGWMRSTSVHPWGASAVPIVDESTNILAMEKTMRILVLSLVAALAVGCVPKGKYTEMMASYEVQLSERDRQLAELEQQRQDAISDTQLLESQLASVAAVAGELSSDVARMRQALSEAADRRRRIDVMIADYQDLLSRFSAMIDAGTLSVKVIDGRMTVQLPTDILFPSGSDRVSAEGQTALTSVATILADLNKEYQVVGHTDSAPIATERFPSNWALGAGRAISVTKILTDNGVTPEQVAASSMGEYRPVAPNSTPEGKARNRRIDIVIVPDLSQLPEFGHLSSTVAGH